MADRSTNGFFYFFLAIVLVSMAAISSDALSTTFYDKACPEALPTIKKVVADAVNREGRMGASLLRLHFHDCFVNGCDGSVLLDSTSTIDGEKTALANNNSIRGFEVVDRIKSEVDRVCGYQVVSCADILAVAARDSVVQLGGQTWNVELGRRDSTTARRTDANNALPAPFMDLPALKTNFENAGLDETDLVALSGGHAIGLSQCTKFKVRIYNDSNIDTSFAANLKPMCPSSGGDTRLSPLDPTPTKFDTQYFRNLVKQRGLLHSDQALFNGVSTDALVRKYSTNAGAFAADFGKSMVKMGRNRPLEGNSGQIRLNCRRIN
ncbi:hypothetical protein C5167_018485 [Papaver somniferum]|uniref:Peroxidase n=1 Tax=Papaver somniferum TaxID=3469 RepID=A0A4Y7IQH9_PAPSO|nr:cationic peroxidase 1-like [Papaver somniferum]RZC50060.1 hypothetical protein C5167_018485 [Papaver somniferum]